MIIVILSLLRNDDHICIHTTLMSKDISRSVQLKLKIPYVTIDKIMLSIMKYAVHKEIGVVLTTSKKNEKNNALRRQTILSFICLLVICKHNSGQDGLDI